MLEAVKGPESDYGTPVLEALYMHAWTASRPSAGHVQVTVCTVMQDAPGRDVPVMTKFDCVLGIDLATLSGILE